MLWELIRYLQHPLSGLLDPQGKDASQMVRGVEITSEDAVVATTLPEPREPVLEVDLREPKITVLHTVLIAEQAVRKPPTLPSRREVRLVRQLGANAGNGRRATTRVGIRTRRTPGNCAGGMASAGASGRIQ